MTIHRRFIFLLQWIPINSLSLGLSLSISGLIEAINLESGYNFNLTFPSFFNIIVAGITLGFAQWWMLKKCSYRVSIRWIMGAAIGFFTVAFVGSMLYFIRSLSWQSSTVTEDYLRVLDTERTGGVIGGILMGGIQAWSIKSGLVWALVNSVGWGLGWSIGRVFNYGTSANYWLLPGSPEFVKVAVQLGALGLIAGFVSSTITGIPLFKLLQQREQRS